MKLAQLRRPTDTEPMQLGIAGGVSLGMSTDTKLSVSGVALGQAQLRKNILGKQRNGLLATQALTSGTFRSYLQQFTTETEYDFVQIGVMNASPTAQPQLRCRIGASEIAGNPASPLNQLTVGGVTSAANPWAIMTVNGNATPALRAVPSASLNNPYITWFDMYPISSLKRSESGRSLPILNVILEVGAYHNGIAANTTITTIVGDATVAGLEDDSDGSLTGGRIWRTRMQNVAAGVDPTVINTTAVETATAPAIVIRYISRSARGLVVINPGDSTRETTGDTLGKHGALQRAQIAQSTPSFPIEIVNCAQAGSASTAFASMVKTMIPEFPNSIVLIPVGTANAGNPLVNNVIGATIASAGSGGTLGAVTLTGTTGAGTPFQATGVIGANGALASITAITVQGNYTQLPPNVASEPVTGGGLVGASLSLSFSGAVLTLARRDIASIRRVCDDFGCASIMTAWLPSSTSGKDWKGSDFVRVNENTLAANSGGAYIDLATPVSGAVVGGQIQIKAGYDDGGGLHFGPTGQIAQAAKYIEFFSKFTGIAP